MTRLALAVLLGMSLGACTKDGFLKAPEGGEAAEKVGGFSSDTHFLLEPTADAESLLGRRVQVSASGSWTIADDREPGCEVNVRRSGSKFKKKYRVGLSDLTAFSGGYKEMLSLEARYGRSVEAEYEIANLETLTADVKGPCGEVIVKSVRVGSGYRKLVRKAEGSAKGRAGKGPIGAEGGREGASEALDSMEWEDPQAYAFSYDHVAQSKQLDFHVTLPPKFSDGETINIAFDASETAYVIVIALEESGAGGVLYPSTEVPIPELRGKKTLVLPGPNEPAIKAQLRDPNTPARETLVVYALTSKDDFERFSPQAMGVSDGMQYAQKLEAAIAKVPISRWARATLTYDIVPANSK